MMLGITVVGSLNMDFVVTMDRLPAPGETTLGRGFTTIPGGKGGNQACAAGKLAAGVPVRMVGRVGYDLFADQLKASLAAAGVDVGWVHATRKEPTGVALIWVEAAGQNSIVVASGANFAFPPDEVAQLKAVFAESSWVLFQLETPLLTVGAALQLARANGAKTILDPAPAQPLPPEMLRHVDLLTPNESEARLLLGMPPGGIAQGEAPGFAAQLLRLGPRAVCLKLGSAGCYYTDGAGEHFAEGFPVEAVDTTAAGDTFNGALAVALAEGKAWPEALRFANAAAALSVTRKGAQTSIPGRPEVDGLVSATSAARK